MNAGDTFKLLNAYHDGELSPTESLEMERRLAAEPDLRATADQLGELSGAVREALSLPPAPPALRGRVVQQLGFGDVAPRRSCWRGMMQPRAAALLMGLCVGGLIGGGGTYWAVAPGSGLTEEAVLAGHLRGLAAPLPFDVASSNRHVVKPWFNGRTTIAPQVTDLADQGFPLAGGRIDIIGGKPVPTLVYRHDQHVISVTVTPRNPALADGTRQRDGYTVERWSAGDLTYWAVSDLDASALAGFDRLFRTQIPTAPGK